MKIKVGSSDSTSTCRDDNSTVEVRKGGHSAKDALKHQDTFFPVKCVLKISA